MATDEGRIDPSNPLYLQPSDHPGLVLVTSAFDGRNFGEWRRSMRIGLSAKNKIGLVNGTLAKPEADSPRLRSWEQCNDMVISWIINAMSTDIRLSVIYTDTAQVIWNELEARFGMLG